MPNPNNPFHPIIYVRGYAMTPNEIDETSADPFCGFNLGSTVFRAVPDKNQQPRKYIFQSPVVRLASDFNYQNVYQGGYDILDPEWELTIDGKATNNKLSSRSIVILRYYDEASRMLGSGKTPTIADFARELGQLILRVRDLVCKNEDNRVTPETFRCYLVAHSMGGLVCRAFLQKPDPEVADARNYVDKFFTYATPHNGIEMAGMNVPGWLTKDDIDNFNRDKMADYLGLDNISAPLRKRVDWLPQEFFSIEKVFCMVGTNRLDYNVALGLSRTFSGNGGDGLVKIENATLRELKKDGTPGMPCAKAFTYRAHSGYFGIVNGEEAYQNLTRFLFGNVRIDMWIDVADIRLPAALQAKKTQGEKVNALYQFEVLAAPKGKLWYLTRRTAEEDSVACLTHEEWSNAPKEQGSIYLSSVFLAKRAKVVESANMLAYALTLGIRVPDYQVDKMLWMDEHYEGGYLFRDTVILEIPENGQGGSINYTWKRGGSGKTSQSASLVPNNAGKTEVLIPLPSDPLAQPGIDARVRFVVSNWNPDAMQSA